MPNWCSNKTNMLFYGEVKFNQFLDECYITGTDDDDDGIINLNNMMPMPAVLEGTQSPPATMEDVLNAGSAEEKSRLIEVYGRNADALKETGHTDWHSWQTNNWGIKWGAADVTFTHVDRRGLSVDVHYLTPWAPFAHKFFEFATLKYHCTIITGCEFEGDDVLWVARFADGHCIKALSEEWNSSGLWDESNDTDDDDRILQSKHDLFNQMWEQVLYA